MKIIARYGEVHLKGRNRGMFLNALLQNVRKVSAGCIVKIENGRYVVTGFAPDRAEELASSIANVFGITSTSVCAAVPHAEIETHIDGIKLKGTFRVEVNRADKKFPRTSMEFAKDLGARIISKNKNVKVDLTNPDTTIYVDIREKDVAYIYTSTISGVGGLPVGVSGRALVMLSGGIDSPVAAWLAAKRGLSVDYLHFATPPFTSDLAIDKVNRIVKRLEPYVATNGQTCHMINITDIAREIREKCDPQYTITILRRVFVRVAKLLCDKHGYDCIVTGENLAQVASQTIQGITTMNDVVGEIPILRPLITYDKSEIIDLAKRIGTFEISTEPHDDCCTVFVPSSPVTAPTIKRCEIEERKISHILCKLQDELHHISSGRDKK